MSADEFHTRRAWEPPQNIVNRYLKQTPVATCENCKVSGMRAMYTQEIIKKTLLRYVRIRLARGMNLCPRCHHALIWERVAASDAREVPEELIEFMNAKRLRERQFPINPPELGKRKASNETRI